MPELLSDFDSLVDAVGGEDLEARFLSHWCPPPLVSACSMAMVHFPEPLLLRNYDFPPLLSDSLALRTHWSGTAVIGMSDCGWGLVDGVSDRGVAVAVAFGGRRNIAEGFGIGLVVRYILQLATSIAHAVELLTRIPIQMSYNLAIVDSSGDHRVVQVAPDHVPSVTNADFAANRQGCTEWPEHAEYCNTVEREEHLEALLEAPDVGVARLKYEFLQSPLHRSMLESTWGTLYTAVYAPSVGSLSLLWPDDEWHLSVHGDHGERRPRMVRTLVPEPSVVRSAIPYDRRVPMVI
jgi:predicted choloylglycine hydrolase